MKAKIFTLANQSKVELENGVVIAGDPGMAVKDLVVLAIEFVAKEYVDSLEAEEVDVIKYKRRATKDLQKVRPAKKGVELELINEILASRGALTDHGGATAGYNSFEDSTDEDFARSEIPPPVELKAKKELKKQTPETEVNTLLEGAKLNIGKTVSFACMKTKKEEIGVINGVRLDRRNNFIQYRIKITSGEVFGKGLDAITILPAPAEPLA